VAEVRVAAGVHRPRAAAIVAAGARTRPALIDQADESSRTPDGWRGRRLPEV
jgi:hypothetical protein